MKNKSYCCLSFVNKHSSANSVNFLIYPHISYCVTEDIANARQQLHIKIKSIDFKSLLLLVTLIWENTWGRKSSFKVTEVVKFKNMENKDLGKLIAKCPFHCKEEQRHHNQKHSCWRFTIIFYLLGGKKRPYMLKGASVILMPPGKCCVHCSIALWNISRHTTSARSNSIWFHLYEHAYTQKNCKSISIDCIFITIDCIFITIDCIFITIDCIFITIDCIFLIWLER